MWQRPGSRHPDVHARAGSGSACPGSAHSPWDSRAPALDCLPRQLTIPAEGPAEVLDYAESHGIGRHSQSQREEDASRVAGPSREGWFRMAARSRQRRNWRPGSVSGIEWPVTVSSFPSFWSATCEAGVSFPTRWTSSHGYFSDDVILAVLDTLTVANGRGGDVLSRTKLTERGRVPEVGNGSDTAHVEAPDDG